MSDTKAQLLAVIGLFVTIVIVAGMIVSCNIARDQEDSAKARACRGIYTNGACLPMCGVER